MLEKLAIELMRHENTIAEIMNDTERFTDYEISENTFDEQCVLCTKIKLFGIEGTIKEYTYYF